jgi:hypothetical protein
VRFRLQRTRHTTPVGGVFVKVIQLTEHPKMPDDH